MKMIETLRLKYGKRKALYKLNTEGVCEYFKNLPEYYVAAEPPVRCGESHPSGQTEPPCY